jgi:hypothetical protein
MNDQELGDLLARYLERTDSQHNSVEEPGVDVQAAAEVVELASLARELRHMPAVAPSTAFRRQARRRLLARLSPRLPWHERFVAHVHALVATLTGSRLRARPAVAWIGVLLLLFMLAGTAYSVEAALPGDTLYPVKVSAEHARLAWTHDEVEAGEFHLLFARRRVNEMARLAAQGRSDPLPQAAHNYVQHMTTVQTAVQKHHYAVHLVYALHEATTGQELALAQMSGATPTSARVDIDQALAAAAESRIVAEELMLAAAVDVVAATDLRLQFADERLTAASTLLDWGQLERVEAAMNEYSSQVDKAVSLVETTGAAVEVDLAGRVAESLARHEVVLSEVEARAPAAALPGIQRARIASSHGRQVVDAIMESRPAPPNRPVVPPGQTVPPASSPTADQISPEAVPPVEMPPSGQTPGAQATDVATTPPGGGPPAWVTPGQSGQNNPGQGPHKGNAGKGKGNKNKPQLEGNGQPVGQEPTGQEPADGTQGNQGQGQGNQGQGQGNQGQGQGNQGQGQGNQGQGQGNQGQGNQGQGNQGQGNPGQGNQGNPPGRNPDP